MIDKRPGTPYPFKKSKVYDTIEDAKADGASDRMAEARMKAQDLAKEMKDKQKKELEENTDA